MHSTLQTLLAYEYEKYKKRGLYSIISVSLMYSYFAYLPHLFLKVYQHFSDYSPIISSFLVHFIIYISVNSLFLLAYKLNHPKIECWRVAKDPWPWQTDPNFSDRLKSVASNILFNQFLVNPIMSFIGSQSLKLQFSPLAFPSLFVNFKQIIIFILIEDSIFYWAHRISHWGPLYKLYHKKHHEFKVTISISSEYAHPIEYILVNILPLGAGPFFYGSQHVHIITWLMWVAFRSIHTSEGHSGYNVPWSPMRMLPFGVSTEYHDYHHRKNLGNFGSMLVVWDTLMGTHQETKEKLQKNE